MTPVQDTQQPAFAPPVLEAAGNDSFMTVPQTMRCDTLYTTDPATASRYGASGDPVPYTLGTDNLLTIFLLLCFTVYVISIAKLKHLFTRQIKGFFYLPRNDDDTTDETAGELRFMFVLLLVSCMLIAVTSFFYANETMGSNYAISNLAVLGVLTALLLVYFLAKTLLYTIVNVIFFDGKKNVHFLKSVIFVVGCQGLLLYPVVLLSVFFDLPLQIVIICSAFILFLNKIACFLKAWLIFFRQKGGFLQTFLYFCALEIIPLLALRAAWMRIVNDLIVNF